VEDGREGRARGNTGSNRNNALHNTGSNMQFLLGETMKSAGQVYPFLKELEHFEYALSCGDHIWHLYFPDPQGRWNHLQITKYRKTFYLIHMDGNLRPEVG
jgi:hypothetical protein